MHIVFIQRPHTRHWDHTSAVNPHPPLGPYTCCETRPHTCHTYCRDSTRTSYLLWRPIAAIAGHMIDLEIELWVKLVLNHASVSYKATIMERIQIPQVQRRHLENTE